MLVMGQPFMVAERLSSQVKGVDEVERLNLSETVDLLTFGRIIISNMLDGITNNFLIVDIGLRCNFSA